MYRTWGATNAFIVSTKMTIVDASGQVRVPLRPNSDGGEKKKEEKIGLFHLSEGLRTTQ